MTQPTTTDAKPGLTPELRFPEFRDGPAWVSNELHTIANPVSERADNEDENNILTLSGEHGLVLQSEYFGKQIAGTNSDRYLRILRDDFVYNDRTTKASAYGTIKRLTKHPHGIVSPIYKCFRFKEGEHPAFWEWYFESGSHDPQLRSLVNEGARAGRFNVSIDRFLSTSVCAPDSSTAERQKIAGCLSTLDELIGTERQKLDALKAHKKGLMQRLFPREGETIPRLRFPEFKYAPEWEEKPLGEVCEVLNGKRRPITSSERIAGQYPYYGASGIVDHVDSFIFDEPLLLVGEDGAKWGAFEKTAFVARGKYWVNNHAHVLKGISVGNDLLENYLIKTDLSPYVTGAAPPKLTLGKLKIIPVPIPPNSAEEQRIASCLSSVDELIATQSDKLEALKTHKKGLMQQLFPSPVEAET